MTHKQAQDIVFLYIRGSSYKRIGEIYCPFKNTHCDIDYGKNLLKRALKEVGISFKTIEDLKVRASNLRQSLDEVWRGFSNTLIRAYLNQEIPTYSSIFERADEYKKENS